MKFYFIFLDILGFEKLAIDIGKLWGNNTTGVRQKFLDKVNELIKPLDITHKIAKNSAGRDDWILVTEDIATMLDCVYGILNHTIEFEGHLIREIPLEVAIGIGEIDPDGLFDENKELIIFEAMIDFLKTYITYHYHKWHRSKNNNQSPKATFIVLTEDMGQELERTGICDRIDYNNNIFFNVNVDQFKQIYKIFRPPFGADDHTNSGDG